MRAASLAGKYLQNKLSDSSARTHTALALTASLAVTVLRRGACCWHHSLTCCTSTQSGAHKHHHTYQSRPLARCVPQHPPDGLANEELLLQLSSPSSSNSALHLLVQHGLSEARKQRKVALLFPAEHTFPPNKSKQTWPALMGGLSASRQLRRSQKLSCVAAPRVSVAASRNGTAPQRSSTATGSGCFATSSLATCMASSSTSAQVCAVSRNASTDCTQVKPRASEGRNAPPRRLQEVALRTAARSSRRPGEGRTRDQAARSIAAPRQRPRPPRC